MSTISDYLEVIQARLQEIYPPIRTFGVHRNEKRRAERGYHASVHHDEDLGDGIIIGYGPTPEAAVGNLCDNLRALLEKKRVKSLCVVCHEDGKDVPGAVSTGDGLMCREHALEWLQSEKEAGEENVGPCGANS